MTDLVADLATVAGQMETWKLGKELHGIIRNRMEANVLTIRLSWIPLPESDG